jgi:hypothetical protein
LSSNNSVISDLGVKNLTNLTSLDLTNLITDEGIKKLVNLTHSDLKANSNNHGLEIELL